MKHYSFICPQGHRQLEPRLPKNRFEPGKCTEVVEVEPGIHNACTLYTTPIYTRWDRFTYMLIALAKKVGW